MRAPREFRLWRRLLARPPLPEVSVALASLGPLAPTHPLGGARQIRLARVELLAERRHLHGQPTHSRLQVALLPLLPPQVHDHVRLVLLHLLERDPVPGDVRLRGGERRGLLGGGLAELLDLVLEVRVLRGGLLLLALDLLLQGVDLLVRVAELELQGRLNRLEV
jgi:hypothetical protein